MAFLSLNSNTKLDSWGLGFVGGAGGGGRFGELDD